MSTEEFVMAEPRELSFDELLSGRIDAAPPFEDGRKVAPYYYDGVAGERIAVILDFTLPDTGRCDVFATSYSGSATGEFRIRVLAVEDAWDYLDIAELDSWRSSELEDDDVEAGLDRVYVSSYGGQNEGEFECGTNFGSTLGPRYAFPTQSR